MSQHDNDLANAAGASFRADLNLALVAQATRNSGATAPATTFAYMVWVDTTLGVVKRRNAANSGWLIESTIDESRVVSRSSNTILDESDIGKLFKATSSFTQTLTAAATLGDGWHCNYRNDGTGIITLDANASETIDGATTITLRPGEAILIYCDGSNFKTIGRDIAGAVLQTVESTPYVTYTNISTQIPTDDTIPQNTEGAQVCTVTITPTNTANRLVLEGEGFAGLGSAGTVTAAIFQDSTANAIAATCAYGGAGELQNIKISHEMAAGTISATTFNLKVGPNAGAANAYTNGTNSARLFGGVAAWRFRVREIKV